MRSSVCRTLPVGLVGQSFHKRTSRIFLYGNTRSATYAINSAGSTVRTGRAPQVPPQLDSLLAKASLTSSGGDTGRNVSVSTHT